MTVLAISTQFSVHQFFEGRRIALLTKHGKEAVIAPLLRAQLGMELEIVDGFDTDLLGTFSGEIERELDPLSAAIRKCELALQFSDCDIAIASEGSFGPHPHIPFANCDEEWVVVMDQKNNFLFIEREWSLETNFSGRVVSTEEELMKFAEKAQFPSHGLILRKEQGKNSLVIKGANTPVLLKSHFHYLNEKWGKVFVETDMRAHCNPTRMNVIQRTTEKLIQKMLSACPRCQLPGFGVVSASPGLPCSLCEAPTNSVLYLVKNCQFCNYSDKLYYPHNKRTEDPMFCDQCNP